MTVAENLQKKKVVTAEEAARRFKEERVIVFSDKVLDRVAVNAAKRPVIGWNIGVKNGPIHAGDSDPDDQ